MKRKNKIAFFVIISMAIMLFGSVFAACGNGTSGGNNSSDKKSSFNLISSNRAAVICVEGTNEIGSTDGDYPGVIRAAYDLQSDVKKITGYTPVVTKQINGYAEYAIIVGTLGKSKQIEKIVKNGKLDVSSIENKWESYILKTVNDPFNDGKVKTALVVAGSDKRGSIYGVYSISDMLGMTPWNFFADSVPQTRENLVLDSDFIEIGEEPAVKYRGIFINDEECLESWARALDEGKHLGPNFYEKLFESLLRMKANYLWPGMHLCSDAFSDYAENPINADYYGIVIGTSHCDMLLRNNINEWDSFVAKYKAEHPNAGNIVYDYTVNPEVVLEYWRQSVEANKNYEVQWTLGMRGAHDEGLNTANINSAPWYGDKVKLMEDIFEAQRNLLREVLDNPTLEDVFMMFIPYKEVQQIYNDGLNVPDDVTIMWADDNHGFIRNFPDEVERERKGGFGVYYHNSYWGPDNESYMWLNSMPFSMVYEEMSKAYDYGVRTAWILNSGDTVTYFPEIEFFVDLGYNYKNYNHDNVFETYVTKMATREFGEEFAEELTEIYKIYTQSTNVRKLEQMSVDIFGSAYGDESEKRAAKYLSLYERAEKLFSEIPESQRDCFYETILFEVRCAYYINAEFYYAHKGNVAYEQGRMATAFNCYNMSKEFNRMRKDEISYYNNILQDGKWKNLVDPEVYHSPVMSGFANGSPTFCLGTPETGVIVEGEQTETDNSALSFYNYAKGRKYIDVFNKGYGSFNFDITTDSNFIKIGNYDSAVYDERRIWIEIDWSKITSSRSGSITITSNGYKKTISVNAVYDNMTLGEKTYLEQDGYVSIEAEHYSDMRSTDETYWTVIKDLGRVSGDMVRAESKTLVGYGEVNYLTEAPYLEYNVYFTSTGKFYTEVYRLPTLSSRGRVRFAVGINNETPVIIEGENDYGTNNPAWEEGVFTQIIKHKITLNVTDTGLSKVRIYMLDPYITIDKMVIYTNEAEKSYFGPDESYNTTYNLLPAESGIYDSFYTTKYTLPYEYDIESEYGYGYFVEQNGKLAIEAETAALSAPGAYVSNGGWIPEQTSEGIAMRTVKMRQDYSERISQAPTMNFEVLITTPGTYKLWVCLNSPMPRSNAYGIGLNGSYLFRQNDFNYSREETFVWRPADSNKTITFASAGLYTLNVYCITDGQSIDKLYLTKTSETPDNTSFVQSIRTPVWTRNISELLADARSRTKISQVLKETKNYYNIVTGENLGEYGAAETETLKQNIAQCYALINGATAVSETDADEHVRLLYDAISSLYSSRNMTDGQKEYLVYENYDKAIPGLSPFGFFYKTLYLSPDVMVKDGVDGDKYFNIRTFNEQSAVEQAIVGYNFAAQNQTLTLQTRISFNEAEWGSLYLLNEEGENSVCIAFEYAYNRYNIVAYNMGVKTILAEYKRNVPVDLKVEINVQKNTFDVYADGNKVAEEFAFRNSAQSLQAVTFGSTARCADMRVYELAIYRERGEL